MSGPLQAGQHLHDERVSRITWASHILYYLAGTRCHIKQPYDAGDNAECDNSDTDEPSDDQTSYETQKAVLLSDTRQSVHEKFLDCIAQLLSPCKGWDGVTATAIREREDRVEVDVVRNDGFLSQKDRVPDAVISYCTMLEKYLAGCNGDNTGPTATSLTEFELKAIDFARQRVDHWIADLRGILESHSSSPDCPRQPSPGQEAANTWTTIRGLILRFLPDQGATDDRVLIVQQAYEVVTSREVRPNLSDSFEEHTATKLWSKLNFLARPLLDCRLLDSIVTREPHFRNCKIVPIPSARKTSLNPRYVVDIYTAWEQLGLGSPPERVVPKLNRSKRKFKQACAETFSLHAEMQLVLRYGERLAPPPTVDYFGCSKKACLLCETVLAALPTPISTRGRHGICKPAWGVPISRTDTVQLALQKLESSLVNRISWHLGNSVRTEQRFQAANTMQSGIVSDISSLTLEERKKKDERVRSFMNEQAIHRNEVMIREGLIPKTRSKDHPVNEFEPEDCCVMCHISPGRLCKRCRSTYYCSRDCQRSDYPSHKYLCRQLANETARLSPEHKRAIFFPVDRDQPCLIWIACRRKYDGDELGPWTEADPHPYLGTDKPTKGTIRIEHNPVRNRNLGSGFAFRAPYQKGHCVSLLHRDAYLFDRSPANRSIYASIQTSCTSIPIHEYCGPMIALREVHHAEYEDITLADFRHLMDYLVSYRNTHIRESVPDLHHRVETTFRGVRIHCDGDVEVHGSERFVSVDVTRANRIAFGKGSISPISVCLGMPIRFWKDQDDEFGYDPAREAMMADSSNRNVAFLMLETDLPSKTWGCAPRYWGNDIGNVCVVREDGLDLSVDDVAMMCYFVRHKMQRIFEGVLESGSKLDDRRRVLELLTLDHMVAYWKAAGEGAWGYLAT